MPIFCNDMKYCSRCTSEQLLIITHYHFFSISVDRTLRAIEVERPSHQTLTSFQHRKAIIIIIRYHYFKWPQPLVTSLQVTYVIYSVLSQAYSHTAYQTRCKASMSLLQLLCELHAVYDTYTNTVPTWSVTNSDESFLMSTHNKSLQLHEKVASNKLKWKLPMCPLQTWQ
jgi:hypothetical protein